MFKISYIDLRSDKFRTAVSRLATCNGFKDIKITMQIGKLAKDVDAHLQRTQKEWLELADPLLERDEKGNFIIDPVAGFTFKDGIEKAQAQKAIEEFTKRETTIEQPKLTLQDVAAAGLSPMELVALEPVLISLESV